MKKAFFLSLLTFFTANSSFGDERSERLNKYYESRYGKKIADRVFKREATASSAAEEKMKEQTGKIIDALKKGSLGVVDALKASGLSTDKEFYEMYKETNPRDILITATSNEDPVVDYKLIRSEDSTRGQRRTQVYSLIRKSGKTKKVEFQYLNAGLGFQLVRIKEAN